MMPLLYILTGTAFYWIGYRQAPAFDEDLDTHPVQNCEELYLFPEEAAKAA